MAHRFPLIALAPARPPDNHIAERLAAVLVTADRVTREAQGDRELYGDLFDCVPDGWPAAALTRQLDTGDGRDHAWMRVDPANFRVEPGSVRLMACGDLGQDADETAALLHALAPMFGDEGFEISAPHPARWYLRAFAANAAPDLPALPSPEAARGGDLFELWPEDDVHRRWRRIFSQAQILLAQHPVNLARAQAGRPAINGVWFWGAGRWPTQVRGERASRIVTEDPLLVAMADAAGIAVLRSWSDAVGGNGTVLLDLRSSPDPAVVLESVLGAWHERRLASLEWRAPNAVWTLKPWHRLRFWR